MEKYLCFQKKGKNVISRNHRRICLRPPIRQSLCFRNTTKKRKVITEDQQGYSPINQTNSMWTG